MRIADTDPDELDDDLDDDGRPRSGPGSRRRRWVVFAGAALVVGGAIAGAIALGGDDEPATKVASSSAPDSVEPVVQDEPVVEVGPDPNGFPDYGSDYMGPQLEMLFQRTTDAGIRLTLQNSGDWQNFGFAGDDVAVAREIAAATAAGETVAIDVAIGPPATIPQEGWIPPLWCNPVGGFRLTMLYKDAVGVSNGSRYGEPRNGLSVTLFSSGYAEGVPFRALVLNVADDVVSATATWDDDATDTAAPTNGWVVLATPGETSGKFELVLQTEAGERTIAWNELPQEGDLEWQKGCSPPPPELPPAGEQPDDPQAAEDEIRATFEALFARDVAFEEKGELVDDTTGIQDAIDAMRDGGFADVAESATHTLTELVFVSPDEAWFKYDLQTVFGDFSNRFGIAYFIDGKWRISRVVVCQDLALTGVPCNPPVNEIYPAVG